MGKNVKLYIKGKIDIEDYNKKIIIDRNSKITIDGIMRIKGRTHIGENSGIYVGDKGVLSIGENFIVTSQLSLNCLKHISIGSNVLVSWSCTILDSDFHKIYNNSGDIVNSDREILINNNTWIGNNVVILKGSNISSNCIIGAGSVVSKKLEKENSIYCGNPVKYIKGCITWDY